LEEWNYVKNDLSSLDFLAFYSTKTKKYISFYLYLKISCDKNSKYAK